MINAIEFKEQMREIINARCPANGCNACPLDLHIKVGITLYDGSLDATFCMSLLAGYLDREWKKYEKNHPSPIIDADTENTKIHLKAPQ